MVTLKRKPVESRLGCRRYVRRDTDGMFDKEVDVGKVLAADQRQHREHRIDSGRGDRGDR